MSDRCYRCGGQSTTSHVCPPLHAGQSTGSYTDHRDSEILALKAENKALTAGLVRINRVHVESCDAFEVLDKMADRYQAQLKRYTSWQPSDPGTKEAMEIAARNEADRNKMGWKAEGWERALGTLAHTLRAAMVRLEEAEKSNGEVHAMCVKNLARAEAAESQVAALTASLASMTKERDLLRDSDPRLEAVAEKLENLASDLEECGRLAHIEAAEQRTYKSLGAQARKILAALRSTTRGNP